MRHEIIDASQLELTDKVVSIKRVTKVTKGGNTMRFTALVVVGDMNGHVGVGLGKAKEIPEAIRGITAVVLRIFFSAFSLSHRPGVYRRCDNLFDPAVIPGTDHFQNLHMFFIHNLSMLIF